MKEIKVVTIGELAPICTSVAGIAKAFTFSRQKASVYVNEMKTLPQFKEFVLVISNNRTLVDIQGFYKYMKYLGEHYAKGGVKNEK